MRTSIIALTVICILCVIPLFSPFQMVTDAGLIHINGLDNPIYAGAFIRLLRNVNYTLYYRDDRINWLDCTSRLHVSYRIINDHHRKFTLDFQSFYSWADYRLNVSINGVDDHVLDTANKTLILYMSSGDVVGFNYSDVAALPNLVLSHGDVDTVFWFSMQRDHIRNVHVIIDPSYFIVSCYNGDSTFYNSNRLIARSHNGTIFMSSYNETTSVIYKNFNNGSGSWVACAVPVVGYDDQPYKLLMTRNDSLWAFWSHGYNINYSISLDFGVTWSAERRINNASFVSYDPAVCLDSLNNIHLVFYGHIGGSYWQLSYFKYNYTSGWGSVTLLTTFAVSGILHNSNPSIACSLNDSIAVAYREGSNYIKCALYYGGSWHLRIEVYHTTPTLRAQNIPCVIFDQLNVVCVVWAGRYDATSSHLRINYATCSDWLTFSAPTTISSYNLYQYDPSIGCSLDNEKYVAWDGRDGSGNAFRHILYTYTIGGVWQAVAAVTVIDGYNDYSANILYGTSPVVDGISVTNPNRGFCMIFSNDKNITFYASSDLGFQMHKRSNVTLSGWYPNNGTGYDTRFLMMPLLWFNVTVNDDVAYSTRVVMWVDGHKVYTSPWGLNRTVSVNLSSVWWVFNFTLGTQYDFVVNGSDTQGYYKTTTHKFSYVGVGGSGGSVSMMVVRPDYSYVVIGCFAGLFFGSVFSVFKRKKNKI